MHEHTLESPNPEPWISCTLFVVRRAIKYI